WTYYCAEGLSIDMDRNGSKQSVHTPIPPVLWVLVAGMVIGVGLLIALPVAMAVDRPHTEQMIMNDQPDLDPSHLGFAFIAVTVFASVLHGIDVVLTVWFGVKALRGKQWA